MSENKYTAAKTADELRDGDEFSVDGGLTWQVCAVAGRSSVAVYADSRRGDDAPTRQVDVEQNAPVLVRTDMAFLRRAISERSEFVLDLVRITKHVRVLGVDAHLLLNNGGIPVIVADVPSPHEDDGHGTFRAVAAPAAETMPPTLNEEDMPRVVSARSFLVGADPHDLARAVDCGKAGIHDEALVAHLIAAQAAARRGTLVDDDTIARISRGEVRPGWRLEQDAPTDLGDGNWVTRYVHTDGPFVDDNTRNIPDDLREDIVYANDSRGIDEQNFVGHKRNRGSGQFPSLTVAMLFAEGHV